MDVAPVPTVTQDDHNLVGAPSGDSSMSTGVINGLQQEEQSTSTNKVDFAAAPMVEPIKHVDAGLTNSADPNEYGNLMSPDDDRDEILSADEQYGDQHNEEEDNAFGDNEIAIGAGDNEADPLARSAVHEDGELKKGDGIVDDDQYLNMSGGGDARTSGKTENCDHAVSPEAESQYQSMSSTSLTSTFSAAEDDFQEQQQTVRTEVRRSQPPSHQRQAIKVYHSNNAYPAQQPALYASERQVEYQPPQKMKRSHTGKDPSGGRRSSSDQMNVLPQQPGLQYDSDIGRGEQFHAEARKAATRLHELKNALLSLSERTLDTATDVTRNQIEALAFSDKHQFEMKANASLKLREMASYLQEFAFAAGLVDSNGNKDDCDC